MHLWTIWLSTILLIESGMATDVPFVFTDKIASIASYTSEEIASTSEHSPDLIGVPKDSSPGNWDYHLDAKIEPGNSIVREEVARLKGDYSGYPSITNICSIFEYYKHGDNTTKGWRYIDDPRGLNWAYANESIQIGRKTGYAGAGDCDDFAVVMSALVESIGGTSRIVVGSHKNRGPAHAFAEVYLGQDNHQDCEVECIILGLMSRFDTNKIYTHVDTNTKDVWLNLDSSANHPGESFYLADEYEIHNNEDQYDKTSLMASMDYPYYAEGWEIKGWELDKAGRYGEALTAFDEAIKRDPNQNVTESLYGKGDALYNLGNYDEALRSMDKCSEIQPNDGCSWCLKGQILNKLGRSSEAEAANATCQKFGNCYYKET